MKKYIVFDTEYTSWEGSLENNWSRENEFTELVQISAIKVTNFNINKFNIYIKPIINPILSDYFINLTGITNNMLINAVDFKTAINKFKEFCEDYPLYSYGNDLDIIEENYKLNNLIIDSNWTKNFLDFTDKLTPYNIDKTLYTSGTIYKAFNININNHNIHNAEHDTYSLYLVSKIIF